MASLADLFNPTFLMFLGILVLVVALLVVYFESKMRDQNHKIASMLSLVSTLAEI
jgi:cell division protein FtsL